MRRTMVFVAAAVLAMAAAPVAPAASGDLEVLLYVQGVPSCDQATGDRIVTWTATNDYDVDVSVTITDIDFFAVPAPADVVTTPFVPDPVPAHGTATATSRFDGTVFGGQPTGDIAAGIVLDPDLPGASEAVTLSEPCPQPIEPTTSTTTTTVPTTTTTTVAVPQPTSPAFTG